MEERRSALVVRTSRRLEVLPSVELDGQPFARAIEVQDVRPARMLAPELEPRKSLGAQGHPKRGFCGGAISAKNASTLERDVHAHVFGPCGWRLLSRLAIPSGPSP